MLDNYANKAIFESTNVIYVWEVVNLDDKNFFQVENNSINFWQLNYVAKLQGEITQSNLSFNEKEDSISGSNIFFNSDQISFTTNDNPLPKKDRFYLYSKDVWDKIPPDFYYLENSSSVSNDELNELSATRLFDIVFQNIKLIKSYNNNFFNFEKYQLIEQKPIPEINITLKKSILINQISVMADIKRISNNEIQKNVYLSLIDKNENKSISFFANPINIETNNFQLYFSTFKILQDMQINEFPFSVNLETGEFNMGFYLSQNVETAELGIFQKVQNNLINVLKELIFVTQTLASNFTNTTELTSKSGKTNPKEQREWFQTEIFSGNDPQKYNDFKIQHQYEQLIISGANELAMKFLNVIIALSSQIKSSYCWKGGLTEEHKLSLPFYFYYVNDKFYLLSGIFEITKEGIIVINKRNFALSKKDFEISNKMVSLPNLPVELEAQNISNSPLDFNENSFNFNYPVTLFFSSGVGSPIINLFDTHLYHFNEQIIQETKFYKTQKQTVSEESEIPTTPQAMEKALRDLENIPNDFISRGDIEIIEKKLETSVLSGVGSEYGENWNFDKWHYKIQGTFIRKNNLVRSTNIKYVFQNEEELDAYQMKKFQSLQEPIELKLTYDNSFGGFEIIKIKKIIIKNIFGKEIELSFEGFQKRKINLFSKYNKKNTTTIINF